MKFALVTGQRLLHITQKQGNRARRYSVMKEKKYREMRNLNGRPSGEQN